MFSIANSPATPLSGYRAIGDFVTTLVHVYARMPIDPPIDPQKRIDFLA
jgi:hypothetical protein